MSRLVKFGASLLIMSTFAHAVTQDEVKSFVLEAANYCKDVGVATCVEEFNKPESKWVIPEKDLYIWANDFEGVITAHPKKPIKGKNLYRYKDKEGTQLFKNFIDKVKAEKEGWVDYVWAHPTTGKQTPKSSFVIGIGDNQLIGAGMYK